MEEVTTRAIIIGVSLFMVIATVSALLLYYNSAVKGAGELAKNAGQVDSMSKADKIMKSEIEEDERVVYTGIDVRNLIRKYAGEDNIKININNKLDNVNNAWLTSGSESTISDVEILHINLLTSADIWKNVSGGVVKITIPESFWID